MPQDGANNYYYPPGTPGIPDQTIESEAYNTFLDDLVLNDLNIARPVHRGGTGATTATQALLNLRGEIAKQVVTNYDSHAWVNGSFASNAGASAAPTGEAYVGTYIEHTDARYAIIEARNLLTGLLYVRAKSADVWSAWSQQPSTFTEFNANYVNVTGDTITGSLNVTGALQQNGSGVWTSANFYPWEYVPFTGGTMSGALALAAGSTVPTPAAGATTYIATAALVEDRGSAHAIYQAGFRVAKTGDTMTGDLTVNRTGIGTPGTGVIFFGNTANRYLAWDGTNWTFSGGTQLYAPALNTGPGICTCGGYWIFGTSYHYDHTGIFALQGYKPGGGDWVDTSDSRIKNILGDYTKGLDAIKQLTPKVFTYKGNDVLPPAEPTTPAGAADPNSSHYQVATDGKEFAGLIAQEAEVAMPELVTKIAGIIDGTSVTDLRTLDTGPLIYALINAIKELAERVEQLEAV